MTEFSKRGSRSLGAGGPVFTLPPTPPTWGGQRADVIRIVDPTGQAVAWFAPDRNAHCVGLAVRTPHRTRGLWTSILAAPDPDPMPVTPFGCAVLARPAGEREHSGAPLERTWQLLSRDPTSVTLGTTLDSANQDREGGPAHVAVDLSLEARLDDAVLAINLTAINRSSLPSDVMVGLQPSFTPEFSSRSPECIGQDGNRQDVEHVRDVNGQLKLATESAQGSTQREPLTTYQLGSEAGPSIFVMLREDVRYVAVSRAGGSGVLSLVALVAEPGIPFTLPPDAQIHLGLSISVHECEQGHEER